MSTAASVVTSSGGATGDVGISPVLLQAITHTLSSGTSTWVKKEKLDENSHSSHQVDSLSHLVIRTESGETHPIVKVGNSDQPLVHVRQEDEDEVDVIAEQPRETYLVVQQQEIDSESQEVTCSQHIETVTIPPGMRVSSTIPGDGQPQVVHVGEIPKPDLIVPHAQNGAVRVVSDGGCVVSSDMNVSSLMLAITSHLKNKKQQAIKTENGDAPTPTPLTITTHAAEAQEVYDGSSGVTFAYANGTSVPSPANDVIVSDMDSAVHETVTVTSETVGLENGTSMHNAITRVVDIPHETVRMTTSNGGETMIILAPDNMDMSTLQLPQALPWKTMHVVTSDQNIPPEMQGGCPICGDRISGYHYGIYSCESCKGFFKRTVQNKKTFICHRKGECEVNIVNRKKCPACRFTRCLVAGMKLEAIREDRTRGGRSSYGGCSPHGLKKPPQKQHSPAPSPKPMQPRRVFTVAPANPRKKQVVEVQQNEETKVQQMVDVVSMTIEEDSQQQKLLEDLLAVEVIMADDEEEQTCCHDKLTPEDADIFTSLLHFADHSLYKIVQWARNLPDFAQITTDDQILLLQNCWAELLFATWCWRSVTPEIGEFCDCLRLPHGRLLDQSAGNASGLGEVVQRLLSFADTLNRLQVDVQEMLVLKVLLLFSPDVRDLREEDIVWSQQDEFLHILHLYMNQHYPTQPNKLYQLLACLPELTRTCLLAKEQLTARQAAGEVPHYSLLSELLKGDITVT